ncbi:MAG TPA: serine/threonine-protein kinase [Gemmatimonadaceae bacterium]|nr:serine/threonine-protein kinase [Gemmatimonadaceae bacterium]
MSGGHAELRRRLAELLQGRYEVQDLLGAGGMAAVFRARDLALDRTVAIKVLPPDVAHDERLVSRFEQEARIAAKLDHPNIIPIHRVESEGGLNYFVMKFVAGRSLEEVLAAARPQDAEFTLHVLLEAAAALGHAHERGVVHRDVKPANIMLDANDRVVLTDFGISKAMEGAAGLTKTGIIVGTPHYMAPEQAMGLAVDGRADQYALACVGYHMLSGELPFPGDTAHAVLHRHIYEEPKPLAARRPDVPRAMVRAIARAMSKEPADRYLSMAEFAAALEGRTLPTTDKGVAASGARRTRGGGTLPPTVSVESPTAPTGGRSSTREFERRMTRDRRLKVAGWVAAFAVVGAAGVALARAGGNAPPPAPSPAPVRADSTAAVPVRPADTGRAHADSAAAHDTTSVPPAPAPAPAPAPRASAVAVKPPKRAAPKAAPAADSATLLVNAEPFGTVYLDGRNIGDTPLFNVRLAVGRSYELRIEHEGYKTYRQTIRADGPNTITVRRTLEPAQ